MLKRLLFLGIVSGLLAGVAAIIYQKVYSTALSVDFSAVVKTAAIPIATIVGCLLAALGNWVLYLLLKSKSEVIFNLLFAILSFASIAPAFGAKLPLDSPAPPELLPGLVIPMHFFPIMAYLVIRPLFIKNVVEAPKA